MTTNYRHWLPATEGDDSQYAKGEGLGLRIMVYRAHNPGGDFTIQGSPDAGIKVSCRLAP